MITCWFLQYKLRKLYADIGKTMILFCAKNRRGRAKRKEKPVNGETRNGKILGKRWEF
jgi:hypothetical protein